MTWRAKGAELANGHIARTQFKLCAQLPPTCLLLAVSVGRAQAGKPTTPTGNKMIN